MRLSLVVRVDDASDGPRGTGPEPDWRRDCHRSLLADSWLEMQTKKPPLPPGKGAAAVSLLNSEHLLIT